MCDYLCCCGSDDIRKKRESKVSPELIGSGTNSTITQRSVQVAPVKRGCTDVFFLILHIAFIIVLAVLVSYCIVHGNIYRILNGYDDCGNVCGVINEMDNKLGCKGADKRKEKFLLVEKTQNNYDPDNPYIHRQCVESCNTVSGYRTFLNRCVPTNKGEVTSENLLSRTGLVNYFQDVSEDLSECWREIIYVCIISFAFSFIVLVLFRFVVGFVVWIVLFASIVVSIIATIFLWVKYAQYRKDPDSEKVMTYLVAAIIATCITAIILLMLLIMRKRIKLVVELFKEAGKALSDMPVLLFEPLLTFGALIGTIALWLYIVLMIESAGKLEVHESTSGASMKISYIKDGVMSATRWVNLFAFLWFIQFLYGCQDFIIAGSVSKWFFTRSKSKLQLPILMSFGHLIRYHLGSICLGSIIIATIQLLRIILKWTESMLKNYQNQVTTALLRMCQCCLACFESFLQYLSKNAYIIISIDGSSFCIAGRRAFQLLSSNALRVIAINSVGDFVLFLGKVFVVVATVLIGIEMIQNLPGLHHPSVPIVLCAIFAFLVSHCFLTVYEMTIDTIFLCFCEDCEMNDGISRPYFMSRNLMEFIQNSKKSMDIAAIKNKDSWNGNGNIQTVAAK
ncbi:hypothetical protein ACKWTF_011243 [Chironomus riparius]